MDPLKTRKSLFSSLDGYSWTPRSSPTYNELTGVSYINNTFIVVGNDYDTILQSDDVTFCNLSGSLLDARTNKPLSITAIIVDNDKTYQTDSDGNYSISGLSCGTHTFTINIPGYATYSRNVDTFRTDYLFIELTKNETVYGLQTPSGYSKDPVNTAIGNYVYGRQDLDIPGRGLSVTFERNYNSQDSQDGPLGFGWNHTYNVKLTVNGDSTVTIRWGDGKTETWTPDGYGGYRLQYGVFDTLIDNGDGTFTIEKKNQTQYNFDISGRLSSIVDKNANAINLSYTGSNLTQITDTVGRNINLTYDGNNRIILIADPIGRTIQFFYDLFGNLTSVTDMNGNTTTYTYDTNHQILTVVDPRGNTVVTNTYDDQKRVVTCQKDAKQGQTTYTYDELNKKTTIVDQLGNTTIHYHDDLLRLIQETDALGNSAYYGYDWAGNRVSVTDKKGNLTQYGYDYNGNVNYKVDALWNYTQINYDANNNPLTREDALWNATSFEYDSNGNLIKTTDPFGNFTTVTYDTNGLPLSSTDAGGNISTYAYDADGNVIESVDALGNKTTFTYDGVGRRLTVTDALGRTTTYTYNDNDNLLTVADPLGGMTTYTYDGNNNKLTATDPKGNTTNYAYDVKDLLTTNTDPLGNTITYTYDAIDRKIAIKDRKGNITNYTYDTVGNLTSVTDPLGNTTAYTYDANGNKLTRTNPLGQAVTYTYDALNRVSSVSDPLGNTTTNTYDALGRISATTNAKGQTTSFQYDAIGRLTTVTDSNGGVVTYTYDANSNRLITMDPKGNTTSYAYDALNRLTQKVEPLGSTYQYSYDAVGHRISLTDAKGNTRTSTYDANNRITGITYPDSSAVTFNYDANGNRTSMIDGLGNSIYTYDALNRMTSYTDPFGKPVGYSYDASGNRSSITYPGGKIVNYSYDSLNRLINVTDWLSKTTTYAYDAAGNLIAISNPNNTNSEFLYDPAGRLTGLSNTKSDSTVISSYTYTLDEIGNHLNTIQNEPLMPILSSNNINYSYDAENRLTNANSTTYTYDPNGNMTLKGSDTFVYDYNNRLTQSNVGGVIAQYSYDGLGNRLMKTEGGLSTQYVLDINGRLSNVLAETNGSPNIAAYYVYGRGLISKILPDGTAYYYHYDSRGSTIALTDSNQNVTDSYAYSSYGVSANSSGSTENPYKYVGRYGVMDEGNGLEYIRARYYAPEFGRFITKDPLTGKDGDSQSLNRYVYALNNPVRLVDVSGLSPREGQVNNEKHEWSSDEAHNKYLKAIRNWKSLADQAVIATQYSADLADIYTKMVERIDKFASLITSLACDFKVAAVCGLGAFDMTVEVGPLIWEAISENRLDSKESTRQIIDLTLKLVGEQLKDKTLNPLDRAVISSFIWTNQRIADWIIDELYK